MATELVVAETNGEIVPRQTTPMEMIALAISQNADIDKLSRLMDLQERWERNEAQKAFVVAMAQFKANPPRLEKVKHVNFSSKSGNTTVDYHYAPLDYVGRILAEALSKYGLSFRWNVNQAETGPVSVTCILQHSQGHSESVSMTAATHDDQRMNAIQRLGATVTYLQRYTLLAATGMATENQDTDGLMAETTNGELDERLEWMANGKDKAETVKLFQDAYRKFEDNPAAIRALVAAKNKKLAEF